VKNKGYPKTKGVRKHRVIMVLVIHGSQPYLEEGEETVTWRGSTRDEGRGQVLHQTLHFLSTGAVLRQPAAHVKLGAPGERQV